MNHSFLYIIIIMYTHLFIISILFIIVVSYQPDPPTIAILSFPNPTNTAEPANKSSIWEGYIRWIEQTGMKIVAIHPWYSHEQIDEVLNNVNGILFIGGNRTVDINQHFEQVGRYIIDKVIEMNKEKDYFPLFGICFGYELLLAHIANDNSIIKADFEAKKIFLPSELNDKSATSRLFSYFRQRDFDDISKTPSTYQLHTRGITPEDFERFNTTKEFFDVTSYATDKKGTKFINSIEGKNFPIYGIQYHPEVVPYARSEGFIGEHSREAIRISQLHGVFFLSEAARSHHRMDKDLKTKFEFVNSYEKPEKDSYRKGYYTFAKKD